MTDTKAIGIFAIGMAFLAWMAVKLPMPAMPLLAHVFHTSSQSLKVSVTLNLIGFSISQIMWGPLSDRYGRRPILLCAYILALIGTILAMASVTICMFIIARIIEGFAVGASAPIGRAIMADKLERITMAKLYSWYAIAAILPPAVGPVIGGYLLVYLGWRYIFAFLFIIVLIYVIASFIWFPETHKHKLDKIRISHIVQQIVALAKAPQFWTYVITYALINGFMIAYYAAMPYWYVVQFHMSDEVYAWLAFLPIASYILGTIITNRLLSQFTMDTLLLIGILIAILTAVIMLILAFFTKPSLVLLNFLMTLFSVASGVVTPMTNASLMHAFREKVTILSAVMSGMRVGGAGLLVLISTNIILKTYWPLFIYTAVVSLLALFCYIFFKRMSMRTAVEPM